MRTERRRSTGWFGPSGSGSSIGLRNRMGRSVTRNSISKAVGSSLPLRRRTTRVRSTTARRAPPPRDGPRSPGWSTASASTWTAWTPTSRGRRAPGPGSSRSRRTTRTAGSTGRRTSKATAGCSSRSTESSRAAGLQELHDGLVTLLARVSDGRGSVVADRLRVGPCIEQHLHDGQISVRGCFVERGVVRFAADVRIAAGGEQRLHEVGMVPGDRGIERGVREPARLLEIHVRAVFEEDLCGVEMTEERGQAEDRKSTRLNSSHVASSYAVFCLKKKSDERDRPERDRDRVERG